MSDILYQDALIFAAQGVGNIAEARAQDFKSLVPRDPRIPLLMAEINKGRPEPAAAASGGKPVPVSATPPKMRIHWILVLLLINILFLPALIMRKWRSQAGTD